MKQVCWNLTKSDEQGAIPGSQAEEEKYEI